jgi:hypothetical protein
MYDKFKNFAKIVENSYGPVISNRRRFPFFGKRDDSCLLPQFGRSILR